MKLNPISSRWKLLFIGMNVGILIFLINLGFLQMLNHYFLIYSNLSQDVSVNIWEFASKYINEKTPNGSMELRKGYLSFVLFNTLAIWEVDGLKVYDVDAETEFVHYDLCSELNKKQAFEYGNFPYFPGMLPFDKWKENVRSGDRISLNLMEEGSGVRLTRVQSTNDHNFEGTQLSETFPKCEN